MFCQFLSINFVLWLYMCVCVCVCVCVVDTQCIRAQVVTLNTCGNWCEKEEYTIIKCGIIQNVWLRSHSGCQLF